MLPSNADRIPCLANNLGFLITIQFMSNLNSGIRELKKCALYRYLTRRTERLPPDLSCLFPTVATEFDGCEHKSFVGDTRVVMHPFIVIRNDNLV